ncbi:hypothetical protein Lal_00041698 [Lupinus albus]|nr:hypothetical protein Lal_00041698 [Lupinus albus]
MDSNVANGVPDTETLYHHSQTMRYISPDGAYSVGAVYNNLIQTIDYVHLACKELVKVLAELNPPAFNISRPRASPPQHFAMFVYDSGLQHQSSSEAHFQPQPQMSSPHLYGEQPYGAFTSFPTNYHMSQSSQYQGSLPSMFDTTSNTSMSTYGSQDFYRPLCRHNDDDDNGDEGKRINNFKLKVVEELQKFLNNN